MTKAVDNVRWRRIAAELRQRIADGLYPVAEQIPSQRALAAEFDVDANVIRRALEELTAEGLLDSHQGKATFVLQKPGVAPAQPPSPEFVELSRRLDEVSAALERLEQRVAELEPNRKAAPKRVRRPSK